MAPRFILRVRSRLPVLVSLNKARLYCIWFSCVPRGTHFPSCSSRLGSTRGIVGLVVPSLVACASLFEPAVSCAALEGVTRLQCVCRCCVISVAGWLPVCCSVDCVTLLAPPNKSACDSAVSAAASAPLRQHLLPFPSPAHSPSLHQVRDLTRLSLLPTHVLEAAAASPCTRLPGPDGYPNLDAHVRSRRCH